MIIVSGCFSSPDADFNGGLVVIAADLEVLKKCFFLPPVAGGLVAEGVGLGLINCLITIVKV